MATDVRRHRNHEPVSAGLGVMLYEMLTGAALFQGDTAAAVLSAIVRARPRPIAESAAGIPAPVAAIVARALEIAPDLPESHAARALVQCSGG